MTRITGSWWRDKRLVRIFELFGANGFRLYAVGGAVRDDLLGMPVGDVDLATDARPDQVVGMAAETKGVRAVPTGIEHGTVTLVTGGAGFEVTTFRRDVDTDGRRAVVAFSDDIEEDARRRDFTMNALYASSDGAVVDPLGGIDDLRARRVRFIEDADARIREDYLRALRFFRFHAWYGDPAAGLDPDALDAIASNLDGLDRLAVERVTAEMLKLLSAPDPAPAVAAMELSGVLARVLPGATAKGLGPLVHLEAGLEPDPIRRLAVLGPGLVARLRLSKAQARRMELLGKLVADEERIAAQAWRHGGQAAVDAALIRAASTGTPLDPNTVSEAERGAAAVFPIRSGDLMPAFSGKALGQRMTQLQEAWIASDFQLSKKDLLNL